MYTYNFIQKKNNNNHVLIDKPALHFISIITSALHTQCFQKSSGACGTPEKNTEKKEKKKKT